MEQQMRIQILILGFKGLKGGGGSESYTKKLNLTPLIVIQKVSLD